MSKRRAAVVPPHAMALFAAQCLALGMNARDFGRKNGLTKDQCARLSLIVKEKTHQTFRATEHGSIIPANAAHTLSALSNRMVSVLLGQGKRAVEALEILNARYEPRVGKTGKPVKLEWSAEDRAQSKWASEICWRIVGLARKDGRDPAPPGPDAPGDAPPAEPIDRRPRDAEGMVVVTPEGKSVEISA